MPRKRDSRILIVDDDPRIVGLLETLLADAGYSDVISTTCSREVLASWAGWRPDAVLLDVHMPEPDGLAILRELKRHEHGEVDAVPVIMLTGDETGHTRRAALALGATDFVTKPFDATEVRLRLRNALTIRNHHLQLEQRVRLRTGELEVARLELLHRLALTAEFRDDETHQHTQRVGRTADFLAEILSPDDADVIRLAAPLHDIGKVGIPDAILLKPGKLTAAEFERMKQHTHIGKLILQESASPVLRAAEQIAFSHHERWDGRGYPLGQAREEIPLSGRITAVADVFDALTHERPYKPAAPLERAVDEILVSAGTQFDPRVVEAFAGLAHAELVASPEHMPESFAIARRATWPRPGDSPHNATPA
jgi:response regulator RpfG family c-di-GMP phosphodiesterase